MVRHISLSTGDVTTLAGTTAQGRTDGIGTAARFLWPVGVTIDPTETYALVVSA